MIDLHVHSVYSDGTSTPSELVAMAETRGLKAIALTDHDTVAGVVPILEAAKNSHIEVVPGIELSAECDRGTMHLLGYFIDHTSETLLERMERVRKGRAERNQKILKKLNKLGYVLMWSDVKKCAGRDVVGRPHFAEALLTKKLVKSRKAAFDLLLAKGRPAYAERYRYTAEECIEIIRNAGGISVLAHPATLYLPDDDLLKEIRRLRDYGLGGLEVYYAEQRPENISKFAAWADDLGLIATGGTDFHGKNTPDLKIGTGFGQLRVPDEALEQLKAASGKA